MLTRTSLPGAKPPEEQPFAATMSLLEKCVREYPEREAHVHELQQQAARRAMEAAQSVPETIRLMAEGSAAAIAAMHASALRVMEMTSGCESVALVRMLDEVFALQVQVLTVGIQRIRSLASLDPGASGEKEGASKEGALKDGGKGAAAAAKDGGKGVGGGANAGAGASTAGSAGGQVSGGGEEDMSLIDDDDPAELVLVVDDAQALQGAIRVLRLIEGLPQKLAELEEALVKLLLQLGPQVYT